MEAMSFWRNTQHSVFGCETAWTCFLVYSALPWEGKTLHWQPTTRLYSVLRHRTRKCYGVTNAYPGLLTLVGNMDSQQIKFVYERWLRAFQQCQEQANEKIRILFHQMPEEILEGIHKFLKSEILRREYLVDLIMETPNLLEL